MDGQRYLRQQTIPTVQSLAVHCLKEPVLLPFLLTPSFGKAQVQVLLGNFITEVMLLPDGVQSVSATNAKELGQMVWELRFQTLLWLIGLSDKSEIVPPTWWLPLVNQLTRSCNIVEWVTPKFSRLLAFIHSTMYQTAEQLRAV